MELNSRVEESSAHKTEYAQFSNHKQNDFVLYIATPQNRKALTNWNEAQTGCWMIENYMKNLGILFFRVWKMACRCSCGEPQPLGLKCKGNNKPPLSVWRETRDHAPMATFL